MIELVVFALSPALSSLSAFVASAHAMPNGSADATALAPRVLETRTYRIRQTVAVDDVPSSAHEVRLWVPVPADGAWQRVLERRVVEAPAGWKTSGYSQLVAPSSGFTARRRSVVMKTTSGEAPALDDAIKTGDEVLAGSS